MPQPPCVRTIDLAGAVRGVAVGRDGCRAPAWAATFEDSAFFHDVRTLTVAAGAGDARLYVVMRAADGLGQAYSFGRANAGTAPVPPADDAFPFAGGPPAGDVLLVVVDEVGAAARVSVTLLKDGLHHGFMDGGPARVEASAEGTRASYHAHGVPVTDLVLDPAPTAAAALSILRPADLVSHSGLLAIVAAAEAEGAGVVLRTYALPGAVLARPPGADGYALMDRGMARAVAEAWNRDAPVLTVAFDAGGSRCLCTRRVAGLIHGETPASPGACVSIWSQGATDLRFTPYHGGRPTGPTLEPVSPDGGRSLRNA